MIILGYSAYVFDSAAALIIDGKVIAACQEERFTRIKNTGVFPRNAIQFCLDYAGITIEDVDHVCFYWKPFKGLPTRAFQIIKGLPMSLKFYRSHSNKWSDMVNTEIELKKSFPGTHKFSFHNVDHHISHAASAYYISPFEESSLLIMDGSGEISATSFMYAKNKEINTFKTINFPHSLGYLYVALTHYLGFKPDNDEYKVMALASMGQKTSYYEIFKKIIKLNIDGTYTFDLSYFYYHKGNRDPWVSEKFINEFGPIRKQGEPLTIRQENIAWALQKRLEDTAIHMANHLYKIQPCKNLMLAGGVALNCVMNEKIRNATPYENVVVMSAPHDAGTSVGAALYIYNKLTANPNRDVLESAYLGPEFSNDYIKDVLENSDVIYEYLEDSQLYDRTSNLLIDQNIIGWFQGRTEFGPRALGSRSILGDPRTIAMKDKINAKIKHRESFRPFAPAILEEFVSDYFEDGRPLPYMTFVLNAKKEFAEKIPAVVHFDHTARVQTVNSSSHKFYKLIKKFYNKTGVPVLLNTSFNDNGEPIVNSPEDALSSFKRTNLDYLVIGNFIIKKPQETT